MSSSERYLLRCVCFDVPNQPPKALLTLRKFGIASAVVYTMGIPLAFGYILLKHRHEIRADQELLARGLGGAPATNPNFHIRQRFNQLYETFQPGLSYWRLVLILRKFAIVAVAVSLIASPMLQASLSVAIIFTSYALQVNYRPFVDATSSSNEKRLDVTHAKLQGAVLAYLVPFNRLEAGYLVTSMITLFAGMIFQSGYVAVSSRSYMFLTVVVSWRVSRIAGLCGCFFLTAFWLLLLPRRWACCWLAPWSCLWGSLCLKPSEQYALHVASTMS